MWESHQEEILMKRFLYIALIATVLLSACGVIPAFNPTPTSTPLPTNTPEPTLTPTPTATSTPVPTSTPDVAATHAAQATQTAGEVLEELDRYLGEKSNIDYQSGHLLWQQSDSTTLDLSGPDEAFSEIDSDITAGNFIFKSDVTWEATALLVCGAVF